MGRVESARSDTGAMMAAFDSGSTETCAQPVADFTSAVYLSTAAAPVHSAPEGQPTASMALPSLTAPARCSSYLSMSCQSLPMKSCMTSPELCMTARVSPSTVSTLSKAGLSHSEGGTLKYDRKSSARSTSWPMSALPPLYAM